MGFALTTISPEARAAFIKDGERFGSEDTLGQANQTLNAYAIHGAKLIDYGFGSVDAIVLQDARSRIRRNQALIVRAFQASKAPSLCFFVDMTTSLKVRPAWVTTLSVAFS